MGFEPENELEKVMLLASSEEAARPAFYRLLLDSELVVLGGLGKVMELDTIESQGQTYHAVFTSQHRLQEFLREERAHFVVRGSFLFRAARGASFVLNPGSDVNKVLTPEEIDWCLEQASAPLSGEILVVRPKAFPRKLVKALCVLFTSRSLIKEAHLVHVMRQGADSLPYPLIGLVAEEDNPRLAGEIFKAAAEVMPGKRIDVLFLKPGDSRPLQTHILSVPPFYRRTLTLN
jgi:hypothetical protein